MSDFYFRLCVIFYLLSTSTFVFAEEEVISLDINHSANSGELVSGNMVLSILNLSPNSTGLIVSIYRSEKTFLKKADEVYYFPLTALNNNTLVLENIVYGDFVIAVAADQNANQRLDTKIFGIPSEPVGFAGNAKSRFGPPRFSDNLITYSENNSSFTITLVDI